MRSIVAQWPDRPGRDLFVHRRGNGWVWGILVFVVRRAECVGGKAGGLASFR